MKRTIVFFILALSLSNSHAQFDIDPGAIIDGLIGNIESDRPGQALNAKTAGLGAIQIQTGFNYRRLTGVSDWNMINYLVPTTLRFSFTKKWELNTSFSYNNNRWNTIAGPNETSGFLSPDIGVRYAFLKGDGWKPYLALQSNLSILSHKGDYQQQNFGSSFYLVTSNRFESMSVNTNFGLVFGGSGSGTPTYPWVLNFGWMLGDKVGTFVEGFGEFSTQILSWDAGFSYVPFSDLQIDLFGGMMNVVNQQNLWFAEIGLSYRFSLFKVIAKKKASEMMNGFGQ